MVIGPPGQLVSCKSTELLLLLLLLVVGADPYYLLLTGRDTIGTSYSGFPRLGHS